MDNEKSNIVGVHRHKNQYDNGVVYWRSQVKRDGVVTTLYYGLDKEEAEKARIAYDRANPDFDPYDYDDRTRKDNMFRSKVFVDWPASKLSYEKKEPTGLVITKMPRTTIEKIYSPYSQRFEMYVNGVHACEY